MVGGLLDDADGNVSEGSRDSGGLSSVDCGALVSSSLGVFGPSSSSTVDSVCDVWKLAGTGEPVNRRASSSVCHI